MALINLRNALMTGGGWKNPYVTDGLVAFYDGTWNAGKGKHDATLTAPVNLVTGEASTPNSGGVAFDSNSIMLASTSKGYASQSLPIDTGDITIDILLKAREVSHNCYCGLTATKGRYLKCEQGSAGSPGTTISVGWGISNAFYPTNMTGVANEVQQKVCIAYRGNKLSLFTNGIFALDRNYTENIGGSPITIGRAESSNTYQPDGNIYRILVYNRALTAEEIAANYAVDKARFNLP